MKIGVDAGCLGIVDDRLKVGVYSVVKNMLIELSKLDRKNEYYLYSFYPIEASLMKKLGNNMQNIVVKPVKGWLKIALPLRLLMDNPDIFLAANQAKPIALPLTHYKTIGIFYDLAFEKYPYLYAYAASVDKHKNNSRLLADTADILIAISKSTKKDIERIYNVNPKKIIIAYPGKDTLFSSSAYRNERPYFLFVGAFKKSKNIPMLLRSFVRFLRNTRKNFDLLLVGGDKWIDPEIEEVMTTIPKSFLNRIRILGFVDGHTLAALYKGAFAFVSPSLYEGFGLPFLEAQSVGIPIIGSYSGSLPEIIGKSGILVNPRNSNMLVKAMTELSNNKELYRKMVEEGRNNVQKYSWKLFAKKIQSAIDMMV